MTKSSKGAGPFVAVAAICENVIEEKAGERCLRLHIRLQDSSPIRF